MSINMGELRRLTDIANDPTLAEAKKKFKVGLERARAKFRENKDQFVNNDDFINFNNNNTNE